MSTTLVLLFILILFYMYLLVSDTLYYENFMVYWSGVPVTPISNSDNYPNWPFWNMRFGQTSNMSYDLRGDPMIIPKFPFTWNYSTLTPIYNKKLC